MKVLKEYKETVEPPPSQLLLRLQNLLIAIQKANQGKLPLNQSTLSGDSAIVLILFDKLFQLSSFTMDINIKISDVNGDYLVVNGQGLVNSKTLELILIFIDNFNTLYIEVLFSTQVYGDIKTAFPLLPGDFFKGILTPDTDPIINLPSGLTTKCPFYIRDPSPKTVPLCTRNSVVHDPSPKTVPLCTRNSVVQFACS